jgi:hypothetical protein
VSAAALSRQPGDLNDLLHGPTPLLVRADSRIAAWFLEPAGLLVRIEPATFVDGDVVLAITGLAPKAKERFPGQRLLYIFDFTNGIGYNTHGRQLLTNWANQDAASIDKIVCIPPPGSAIFRMGLSTVIAALSTGGVAMRLADRLPEVLAQMSVRLAC